MLCSYLSQQFEAKTRLPKFNFSIFIQANHLKQHRFRYLINTILPSFVSSNFFCCFFWKFSLTFLLRSSANLKALVVLELCFHELSMCTFGANAAALIVSADK